MDKLINLNTYPVSENLKALLKAFPGNAADDVQNPDANVSDGNGTNDGGNLKRIYAV